MDGHQLNTGLIVVSGGGGGGASVFFVSTAIHHDLIVPRKTVLVFLSTLGLPYCKFQISHFSTKKENF